MPLLDILSLITLTLALAVSLLLAATLGIALAHKPKHRRWVDWVDPEGFISILTLVARFREGWPTADRQLKWIFNGSLATCAIALTVWSVGQCFR